MHRTEQLNRWRRSLRNTLPIIGAMLRRRTIKILAEQRGQADVIPLLVEALKSLDANVSAEATKALSALPEGPSVNALCDAWARSRDERLGAIVVRRGYVATSPDRVRVVSALKSGKLESLFQATGPMADIVVTALDDADHAIAENAGRVLRGLKPSAALDAVCLTWVQSRDARLGVIIRQQGYVATAPAEATFLSALKCGKIVAADTADTTELLIRLLSDSDEDLRAGALRSLERIKPGPATEALCEETIRSPQGPAAKLCLRLGKRPADHERLCLFLFVTRQLDDYFREDFEFQNLRLEYDRASPEVQQHVMEVLSSGDRRFSTFFSTKSKPITEWSEQEIWLAFHSWRKHEDWERMFETCLQLPLKYSMPMFAVLNRAGWEPELPEMRSLFRQVLADANSQEPPPPRTLDSDSTLLEAWLANGQTGERSHQDESALRDELARATPPHGVEIVGALRTKSKLTDATVRAIQTSPHWLVRLAGHVTGVYSPELTRDEVVDTNYWITELATAKGVWDFWPSKATPKDLTRLSSAPPEAFAGRMGAARRALQTLVAHQVTSGVFQPMVVEMAEDAGQFQLADDADLPPSQQT